MSMTDVEMLFKFIGGLGMFLYGMHVMAEGLQKTAGGKMKKLLGVLTNNRLLAVLVGAGVTAIIQSSSATTVMVVGFVNAGLLNLTQAVGVIMGANIGTTVTGWLVSMSEWGAFLKPEFLAPLVIGIGAFGILFSKDEKKNEISQIAVGFGVLFIGLSFMSGAITPYKDAPIFATAFRVVGQNPFLGILVGAVVTAVIQSSSASVGILQTLAMNGMVNWNSAVFITLGQNIGTCVTALISSAGAQKNAKRAAVIHLLFNVVGSVLFGVIMFVFFMLNKEMANSTISSVEISIFHTIFNVTNTIVLFPFANLLVKTSEAILRGEEKQSEDNFEVIIRHLDDRILETPSFALENTLLEIGHMGELAVKHITTVKEAVLEGSNKKIKKAYKIEESMDQYAELISNYLLKINKLPLTEQQNLVVSDLFYTVSDLERIGDHCDNITELAENLMKSELRFSEKAIKGITRVFEKTEEAVIKAVEARSTEDAKAIDIVERDEAFIDDMEEELRKQHMKRLAKQQCNSNAGIIFLDMLTNLERISDHCLNIVSYVKDEQN
ncbi:MAG: Na/Pi cotransporter family protein [Lachnospiraceae bacterium]|nr:Na/Pi cotransporter family protein [Lachnospiraceae bacterium]